ncbi:MAG: hypothetical protein JWO86_4106 [Myxococcaceae bacterium]|nr:hypothetical protein [Myxococcaceae bacterium]
MRARLCFAFAFLGAVGLGAAGACSPFSSSGSGVDEGDGGADGATGSDAGTNGGQDGGAPDAAAHATDGGNGDAAAGAPMLVFVTSSTSNGDGMGSVAFADAMCQARAQAAGLHSPDRFVAWLSTTTTPASMRVAGGGPWYLPTGALVALDVAQLRLGALSHAIDVDENGASGPTRSVWTGTKADGTADPATCANWTLGKDARSGTTGSVDANWTAAAVTACALTLGFYCFQIP